ncbi:hypothetical protein [Brevibacterium oceani]|uniref:hypothetical protein n=1 Tax=Brevibacterium oceani TaxID=358099 RepID=UPI0015E74BAD|nr:hypothetical protein [Brevibacterium oceani]
MTHTAGEVQHLMRRILDHYPTARDAIGACGMSSETFYRIMRKDSRASLKTPTYQRIMAAAEVLNGLPIESEPGAITWPEVAEYATTPEGLAFIVQCRAPKVIGRAA